MAYFPFFVPLEDKKGLIIGGGAVALRKANSLLDYGPALTVTAPCICRELKALPLSIRERPFRPEDVEGMDFVIAASDDRSVNAEAARLCREKKLPVNVADSPEDSTFLFPSLIRRGDLSVGVSTGGASPTAARWLRQEVEALLPHRTEEILSDLQQRRAWAKEQNLQEKSRSDLLRRLFFASLEAGRALTDREAEQILDEIRKGE